MKFTFVKSTAKSHVYSADLVTKRSIKIGTKTVEKDSISKVLVYAPFKEKGFEMDEKELTTMRPMRDKEGKVLPNMYWF